MIKTKLNNEHDAVKETLKTINSSDWLVDMKREWRNLLAPTVLLEKIRYLGTEIMKGFADAEKLVDIVETLNENAAEWRSYQDSEPS